MTADYSARADRTLLALEEVLGKIAPRVLTIMNVASAPKDLMALREQMRGHHERLDELAALFFSEPTIREAILAIGQLGGAAVSARQVPAELFERFMKAEDTLKSALAQLQRRDRGNSRMIDMKPAKLNPDESNEPSRKSSTLIFVSHRSCDQDMARKLVSLIERSIDGITGENIRCTSLPGYGVPYGKDFGVSLREDLISSKVVFVLLSIEAKESHWVWFEMGASWVLERRTIVILGPKMQAPMDLPDPLKRHRAIGIDDEDVAAGLSDALRDAANEIGLNAHPLDGRVTQALNDFVTSYRVVTEEKPANDTAMAESSVGGAPHLSKEAMALLTEATKDPHGDILCYRDVGGLGIQTNRKPFLESPDPREQAIWKGALQELEENGLIEDKGSNREVFGVTREGYDLVKA